MRFPRILPLAGLCLLVALTALGLLPPGPRQASAAGVIAVAAGGDQTCTLNVAGGVQCWGSNSHGQLGDGTYFDHIAPAYVLGLSSGVAAIATGGTHFTCALTTAGGVKCWGNNVSGWLGDGTTVERTAPVDVVGLESGVAAITTGGSHTCALTTEGGIKCWGDNSAGQLGDGTTTNSAIPVDVVGLESGATAVAAGVFHTCAATTVGGVQCWGNNTSGELGNGTLTASITPIAVTGLSGSMIAVTVGSAHTCALTTAGGVECWGNNIWGQLGSVTTDSCGFPITQCSATPVEVASLNSGVSALVAGGSHTCALTTEGSVLCWGNNVDGQLGDGTTTPRVTPEAVIGLSSGGAAVGAGAFHACAATTEGGLWCWGTNFSGKLGDGTLFGQPTPVDVGGLKRTGEVDCDGDVTVIDALFVLRFVANLQPFADCIATADVNCDGFSDAMDGLLIQRHVAALPVTLPEGCPPIGGA